MRSSTAEDEDSCLSRLLDIAKAAGRAGQRDRRPDAAMTVREEEIDHGSIHRKITR